MTKTKEKPVCATCGGDDVLADAYASWDVEGQMWELSSTFEKGAFCENCDGECRIEWVEAKDEDEEEEND